MNDKQAKILIVRLSALGDVAMTIPVIYSMARRYPHTEIHVLTRPFMASLFVNPPANVTVIKADFKGSHKGIKGTLKLLKMLAAERYSAVADFHNVLRSWIIDAAMKLRGAGIAMVDKRRSHRRRLLKGGDEERYDFINRYEDTLGRLGFTVKTDFDGIFKEKSGALPVSIADGSVGIAPFARYLNKTYPPEMMKEVVRMLSEKGIPVYLFGARGNEAAMLESWAREMGGVISVAGKFTLDVELSLMSRLSLMVSMDSANQHLAALTGIPVLTIWGSTAPVCGFNPYGQPAENSLIAGIECQPCSIAGAVDCPRGTFECLHGITPQTIVKRITSMLANGGKNT